MEFRIADTFTDSLTRLTGDEQKAVKTAAFDLQLNPASPGLSFHKLDRAKDKNFWSIRVNRDIRLIVHRSEASLLLCYVDHHDNAYRWAERRRLDVHPKTGAAQLVEVRETVQEITVPKYIEVEQPAALKPLLFSDVPEDELLGYGVPTDWIEDVRKANEDSLLALAEHLPSEAAQALLELATGGNPIASAKRAEGADPFTHPDAQRRFRILHTSEELQQALDSPWDKWTIFLHPEQRDLVQKDFSGPARVSGSAGTGKTIVALHRAVHLARANVDARVLLTTFSTTLASALKTRLRRLTANEPRLSERLEVDSIESVGRRLFLASGRKEEVASPEKIAELLKEALDGQRDANIKLSFLLSEWSQTVDPWQLTTWEAYRDVKRLGRKTRLSDSQRSELWRIFEKVHASLAANRLVTSSGMFTAIAESLPTLRRRPFDFVVVDEAQDLGVAHLRFWAALAGGKANGLFFAGDLGQRIFQLPFSWKALGVDVRGRSKTLNVNYRTSHQIRSSADRLLEKEIADVDGNAEQRGNTVSVFNGPAPSVLTCMNPDEEVKAVSSWVKARCAEGVLPHEIALFVRSAAELARATAAAKACDLPFVILDERVEMVSGRLSVGTMHLAKGLEFRAVSVMACDDEIIPSQARIEEIADRADLEDVYNTERHLLYVACTRARDHLLVSCGGPPSEFLEDIL